jgi:DNA repair protein RecO (recombination protein O)
MAYRVYTTEGIILAKKDFNEADRLYFIFTEEFGMIKAIALGTRYLKSKLRPNLNLFSFNNFSLILAKDSWRIVDAVQKEENNKIINDVKNLNMFAKLSGLLIRMIKGEEKNEFIWNELVNLFKNPGTKDAEILFLGRILRNLGYLSGENLSKKELIISINKAIKESML